MLNKINCRGRSTVGRSVASKIRVPWFESCHKLLVFTVNFIPAQVENREKEAEMAHIL